MLFLEPVEPSGSLESLELMFAGISKCEMRTFKERKRRIGNQYLPRTCEGCNPCHNVDCDSTNIIHMAFDFSRMDSGADVNAVFLCHSTDGSCARNRSLSAVKHCQESIARCRDLASTKTIQLQSNAVEMLRQQFLPRDIS